MLPPPTLDAIPELPLPIEVEQPLSQVPELSAAGRIVRKKRLTWKLLQQLPAAPTILVPEPAPLSPKETETTLPTTTPETSLGKAALTTICNMFGLYQEYPTAPTHNPNDTISLQDLVDTTDASKTSQPASSNIPLVPGSPTVYPPSLFPFQNSTVFGLMNWMWTGSAMKSISEMKKLLEFLKSDDFKKEDIQNFDIKAETAKLDKYLDGPADSGSHRGEQFSSCPKDHWRESDVHIQVPDRQPHASESDIPTYTIPGLFHRSIVEVIKRTFTDPISQSFHYTPFKSFWHSNTGDSEAEPKIQRVYDELYTSDAMIDAHMQLQQQPPEPGCSLERVIAGMMLWSDSTHLANFGTASLWPIYLYFGNQSKWVRGKPNAAACHHIAYVPKVYTSNSSKE